MQFVSFWHGPLYEQLVRTIWDHPKETFVRHSADLLRDEMFHYRFHISLPSASVLNQINPIIFTLHLFIIDFNIILQTMPISPNYSVPFKISIKMGMHFFSPSIVLHVPPTSSYVIIWGGKKCMLLFPLYLLLQWNKPRAFYENNIHDTKWTRRWWCSGYNFHPVFGKSCFWCSRPA
jgi:hypothetical protein